MKQITVTLLILMLYSCKKDNAIQANQKQQIPKESLKKTITKNYFKSNFRPNEKIILNKIYENEVEFIDYNDDGDYSFMNVKNGAFIYNWERNKENDFCKGDILLVKWKMDSILISGDGETLDFSEIAIDAKKIKDGKVSQFRKTYKESMSYHHNYENKTNWFFDKIYLLVEYYIANSKNELFNNFENIKLEYSIEDNTKDGKEYYLIGIYNNTNHQNSIIQWLYLEPETYDIFEYDLPNDKLIKFE